MTNEYGADQIQVLEGLEPVRKRPGMYIGTTGPRGLHHLVYEVVDNSVDEALAGYCKNINIRLLPDGSVCVDDDGRGIPTDVHPRTGKSALETVLTVLHAGGKFGGGGYKVSGGLHGVGISVVNALSEWVEVTVWRLGKTHTQRFERGVPVTELEVSAIPTQKTGTQVQFKPDPQIFTTDTQFDYNFLSGRMRELAYLNGGVRIIFSDERLDLLNSEQPRVETYYYEGGIREYVEYMNREKQPIHEKIIYVTGERDGVQVEAAFQWCLDAYSDNLLGFANNIRTIDGGTHLEGLKTVLTRTFNTFARKRNKRKDSEGNLAGENIREGLTAVISVKVPDPEFEGQTKTKLGNTEVRGIVDSLVGEVLTEYLDFNPQVVDSILEKAIQAFNAAEAARRARELVRRKSVLESSTLPGKLADCSSRDPSESEIFIVEGDSAGGCFQGDTQVALADGRHLSFKDLVAEQARGQEHWCYTIRADGTLGIERIVHPRLTKTQAEVVQVTLDNGAVICCTPDHRFMGRDGSYHQAADLTPGLSLMPLYRQGDRQLVWCPGSEQWFLSPSLPTGDLPSVPGTIADLALSFQPEPQLEPQLEPQPEPQPAPHNHRVVSVEALTDRWDVYDLEVPQTHNFALASGVFVHNSAKQGRDRRFQAILPLRGKILNIEKTDDAKIYKNTEIQALITALGLGIKGEEFDEAQLRYHRIVIMSVAGDERTVVMDDRGHTELVKIGEFIDQCAEGYRDAMAYQVLTFDPDPTGHTTRFRPLKAVIRHEHKEAMYRLTTRYNRSLKVTSSHSVYVYDHGAVQLKKGNEIRPGDLLVAPRRLPRPALSPSRVDLLETFYQAGVSQALQVQGDDVRRVVDQRLLCQVEQPQSNPDRWQQPRVWLDLADWQKLVERRNALGLSQQAVAVACGAPQPLTISQWEQGIDHPGLPEFLTYLETLACTEGVQYQTLPSTLEDWLNRVQPGADSAPDSGRSASNRHPLQDFTPSEVRQLGDGVQLVPQGQGHLAFDRYLPLNRDLLWFLGWYGAIGRLSQQQVILDLGEPHRPFIPELAGAIAALFGATLHTADAADGPGISCSFQSLVTARLLQAWGLQGSPRQLPNVVFSLSEPLQLAFLEGYFLANGTLDQGKLSLTTAAPDLKEGLLYLFGQLGWVVRTTAPNPDLDPTDSRYTLTLEGNDQVAAAADLWQRHPQAAAWVAQIPGADSPAPLWVTISDDLMGLPVVSNEEIDPVGDYVYDFSVQGDENFICGTGGICAKNTDADVDGAHIRTLLLTFFYRYQRALVDQGFIYIACPPLYKVERGRNHYYCYNERERNQRIATFPDNAKYDIQRFKGLGEMMPKQLWETTMNPETRMMKRIEIEDAAEADRIFTVLMGDRVAPRREFIETYGAQLDLLELDI